MAEDAPDTEKAEELREWDTEQADDDELDSIDTDHVEFGLDNPEWKKYCAESSVICIDGWKGYFALTELVFVHKTVIHEEHNVDSDSGAHTQGVERSWVEVKV